MGWKLMGPLSLRLHATYKKGGQFNKTLYLVKQQEILLKHDIRGSLVEPYPKAVELSFDDIFVGQRLESVQHNEDHITSRRRGNNLATTTLAILGTFDNTGKIKDLDLSTPVGSIPLVLASPLIQFNKHLPVVHGSGDCCQRRELISRCQRKCARELCEQRRLSDRREPHKAHARVS
jgi:hypothetical protein